MPEESRFETEQGTGRTGTQWPAPARALRKRRAEAAAGAEGKGRPGTGLVPCGHPQHVDRSPRVFRQLSLFRNGECGCSSDRPCRECAPGPVLRGRHVPVLQEGAG